MKRSQVGVRKEELSWHLIRMFRDQQNLREYFIYLLLDKNVNIFASGTNLSRNRIEMLTCVMALMYFHFHFHIFEKRNVQNRNISHIFLHKKGSNQDPEPNQLKMIIWNLGTRRYRFQNTACQNKMFTVLICRQKTFARNKTMFNAIDLDQIITFFFNFHCQYKQMFPSILHNVSLMCLIVLFKIAIAKS